MNEEKLRRLKQHFTSVILESPVAPFGLELIAELEAAKKFIQQLNDKLDNTHQYRCHNCGCTVPGIDQARAEERKRCKKIALTYWDWTESEPGITASDQIAQRIDNLKDEL